MTTLSRPAPTRKRSQAVTPPGRPVRRVGYTVDPPVDYLEDVLADDAPEETTSPSSELVETLLEEYGPALRIAFDNPSVDFVQFVFDLLKEVVQNSAPCQIFLP